MSDSDRRSLGDNLGSELAAAMGVLATGILPMTSAAPALALDWQIKAKPGEEIVAHSYTAATSKTCQAIGLPKIAVTIKPEGGSIDMRKIPNLKIAAMRDEDARDTTDHCVGTSADGIGIYYTPRADFHGTDRFSCTVVWPVRRIKDTVTIAVE